MNKRILSVIVFGAALLSVQAQDGKGGISPAMLGQIQQSYQGTPSDKALRNAHRQQRHPQAGAQPGEYAGYGYPFFYQGGFQRASPTRSLPAVAGCSPG